MNNLLLIGGAIIGVAALTIAVIAALRQKPKTDPVVDNLKSIRATLLTIVTLIILVLIGAGVFVLSSH